MLPLMIDADKERFYHMGVSHMGSADRHCLDEDLSEETSDQIASFADLMMFTFKIAPCPQTGAHDWNSCPCAHLGEFARRRDLRVHYYSSDLCIDARKGKICSKGEGCPKAHNVFERWLHPDKYRTDMCALGKDCDRDVCFFAHSSMEIRKPHVLIRKEAELLRSHLDACPTDLVNAGQSPDVPASPTDTGTPTSWSLFSTGKEQAASKLRSSSDSGRPSETAQTVDAANHQWQQDYVAESARQHLAGQFHQAQALFAADERQHLALHVQYLQERLGPDWQRFLPDSMRVFLRSADLLNTDGSCLTPNNLDKQEVKVPAKLHIDHLGLFSELGSSFGPAIDVGLGYF